MARINVVINDEKYDFEKGATLLEIANKLYKDSSLKPIVAFIDNQIFSLDTKLERNCSIKFFNVLDPVGNRIYQKGLLFVLVYAFKELFGYGYYVKACHSIDKAIKIRTNLKLTENIKG